MTNDSDSHSPPNDPEQHSPSNPEISASAPEQSEVGTEAETRADEQPTVAQEMRREFRWFEFVSLFINGALAIIGVIALCIYGGQLGEMKKTTQATKIAADAAKQSADEAKRANDFSRDSLITTQRALLIINPVPEIQPIQDNSGKQFYGFNFQLENTGLTPTRALRVHTNWMYDKKPMAADFSFPDKNQEGLPIKSEDTKSVVPVLGPKDKIALPVGPIPREIVDGVESGKLYLYVYGWARYNDIFDKTPRHVTKWSFEVITPRVIIPGPGGQAAKGLRLKITGTRHNCYDEECKEK